MEWSQTINQSLLFQIRRRFSADFASRKSSSRHREVGRLPRAISGTKVRSVLQLQHRRYGDERHDAEQQGHQHQSLRYAALERIYTYGVYIYIHSRLFAYAHTHVDTHIYTHLRTHFAYTHSNAAAPVPTAVHLHTSRQQSIRPDRNQYTIPFCARSSFAISSAAVYANGAVDTSYDYAVPELGTVPLLNQDAGAGRGATVSNATGDQDSFFSKNSRTKTEDKKVTNSHFLILTSLILYFTLVNYIYMLDKPRF